MQDRLQQCVKVLRFCKSCNSQPSILHTGPKPSLTRTPKRVHGFLRQLLVVQFPCLPIQAHRLVTCPERAIAPPNIEPVKYKQRRYAALPKRLDLVLDVGPEGEREATKGGVEWFFEGDSGEEAFKIEGGFDAENGGVEFAEGGEFGARGGPGFKVLECLSWEISMLGFVKVYLM